MLQDAGNWEAILNWQARPETLLCAIYGVQGIRSRSPLNVNDRNPAVASGAFCRRSHDQCQV